MEVYYCLAVAHICQSGKNASSDNADADTKNTIVQQLAEKKKALEYYTLARAVLQCPSSKETDQELIDILTETIDALKQEIQEMEGGDKKKQQGGGVTTIGFGNNRNAPPAATATVTATATSSSGLSAPVGKSTVKRTDTSNSNSGSSNNNAASEGLQVKKKRKTEK